MRFIARWFTPAPPRPRTRLSEGQVLAIARAAAMDTALAETMTLATVEERQGRIIWLVGSSTVGSGLTIVIDDATGETTSVERWGIR